MPDNTNAEAVRFANEKARIAADLLAQAYYAVKAVRDEWYSNNMGTLFPAGDTVVDGSATDGRHPITGNDVAGVITRCDEIVADFEANNNAKLNTILNVAVHPTR